jgi:hypothetical protein
MEAPAYIFLKPGDLPPAVESGSPYKAVVVADVVVSPEWRNRISSWLVDTGCRYVMAWGKECCEWDSSVDEANLAAFDYGEIPERDFVMTTWHENLPVEEVFWYSQFSAEHPLLSLTETLIIQIASECRKAELLQAFFKAQNFSEN